MRRSDVAWIEKFRNICPTVTVLDRVSADMRGRRLRTITATCQHGQFRVMRPDDARRATIYELYQLFREEHG